MEEDQGDSYFFLYDASIAFEEVSLSYAFFDNKLVGSALRSKEGTGRFKSIIKY